MDTWCSGTGTAELVTGVRRVVLHSARRRESAGRRYGLGSTKPRTQGRRPWPWCLARQPARSRYSRPPTAPGCPRSREQQLLQPDHGLFHGPGFHPPRHGSISGDFGATAGTLSSHSEWPLHGSCVRARTRAAITACTTTRSSGTGRRCTRACTGTHSSHHGQGRRYRPSGRTPAQCRPPTGRAVGRPTAPSVIFFMS